MASLLESKKYYDTTGEKEEARTRRPASMMDVKPRSVKASHDHGRTAMWKVRISRSLILICR